MAYLLTGATGLIGRNLVPLLLRRDGELYLLVREGSLALLTELTERWANAGAQGAGDPAAVRACIHPVMGDLQLAQLGLPGELVQRLAGRVEHFVHAAAVYDMTAPAQANEATVAGTRHALALAHALRAGRFHHVSSVAVSGTFDGTFTEAMLDEGQRMPSPYHAAKLESERLVRAQTHTPWRVYRPSIVVGRSDTGETSKVDGPYYLFKAIQRVRHLIPEWVPLAGPELGHTNIVPVDFVAAAIDHIAHLPDLDGRAFALVSPRSQRSGEVLNAFAAAAHAPRLALRVDRRLTAMLPRGPLSLLMSLPPLRAVQRELLADLGIPPEILGHLAFSARFDSSEAQRALQGTGIEAPPLAAYAARIWDYWERNLDPDLARERSLAAALTGRTVLITGASSGIGRAAALKVAAAGATVLLVARDEERLRAVAEEIEAAGGSCAAFTADLADADSVAELLEAVLAEHAVDMLVNNAGRSIRRSVMLSADRLHDYERTMAINYFGAIRLTIGLLEQMRSRGDGHVVNVSSVGVQINTPRFSAYIASKAALDAFTRVASTELVGDGITFTTIHMPLVRTPMIAPTKLYDSFPAITPEAAAEMVCEALRTRRKQIGTPLGTFGEVAYALAPKAVDQILHALYKVFGESAAARGEHDAEEHASAEQVALAQLMRGVHW